MSLGNVGHQKCNSHDLLNAVQKKIYLSNSLLSLFFLVSIDAVVNNTKGIRLSFSELGLSEARALITNAVAKVAQTCREKIGTDARGSKDGM